MRGDGRASRQRRLGSSSCFHCRIKRFCVVRGGICEAYRRPLYSNPAVDTGIGLARPRRLHRALCHFSLCPPGPDARIPALPTIRRSRTVPGAQHRVPGIGWLQRGRRVAARYDQYVPCCLGFLYLAGTWIWLNSALSTAQVCAQPFPIRPALPRKWETGIFGGTQRKFQGPLLGRIRDGRSHLDLHEDYGTSTIYVSSIPYLCIDNERNVLLVVRYCCA